MAYIKMTNNNNKIEREWEKREEFRANNKSLKVYKQYGKLKISTEIVFLFYFFFLFVYLYFIYFCLCWEMIARSSMYVFMRVREYECVCVCIYILFKFCWYSCCSEIVLSANTWAQNGIEGAEGEGSDCSHFVCTC